MVPSLGLGVAALFASACDPNEAEAVPDTASREGVLQFSEWRSGPEVSFLGISALEIGSPSQGSVIGAARIEVLYDSLNTIRIESRALVLNEDAKTAQAMLAQVGYRAQNPSKGGQKCEEQAWAEGCRIDGHFASADPNAAASSVPPRGAIVDLRVHLPRGWPGKLKIWTEDNLSFAEQFPFRADVKVRNFVGQVEVSADSGEVRLWRDPEAHSALNCTPSQIRGCEELRWAPNSACACNLFSRVLVQMRGSGDAKVNLQRRDIVAYVGDPASAAGVSGKNAALASAQDETTRSPSPLQARPGMGNLDPELSSASPLQCSAQLECEGFDWCAKRQTQRWEVASAGMNNNDILDPRVGVAIVMQSARCQQIPVARDEGDFEGPLSRLRGNLTLCADGRGLCK